MLYGLWFQLILVTQICVTTILGESHYSIIAPGTIRSNRKYSVGVTLHEAERPAIIRIAIASPTRSLNLTQDVTLQPKESKLIDFMPPKLLSQFRYELRAEGVEGIELSAKSPLYALENGGPRIYIESDKAIYKPEDTVQFRVFILDEHLRPVHIVEPIRVQILDADRNRIKQFKDIKLQHGVFSGRFALSKQPLTGQWTISVFLSGKYNQEREHKFEVEKYVLPKFSVHIDTDRYFYEGDGLVKAVVYAKYTYGKYVEGSAEVYLLDALFPAPEKAHKAKFDVTNDNIKSHVYLTLDQVKYASKLIIVATFKEHFTNITATTETSVFVRHNRYNIIVPEDGIDFRVKLPYRLKARVQHWNGTQIVDQTTPMTLSLKKNKYTAFMNSEGVAQFEFEFEPDGEFSVSYDDSTIRLTNIYGSRTSYDYELQTCSIQMQALGIAKAEADPLELEIVSNTTLPYLVYAIVSHGNIIHEEYVQVPPNQSRYAIKLNVSTDIIPQSYLYVHYIENNELRFCEFTIRLPDKFENEISLEAPTSVKPGQEITLNILGQPKSHISIVGVDKSVLLLKSENVLEKKSVIDDLLFDRSFSQMKEMFNHPGYVSGVITLTSAKFYSKEINPHEGPTPAHADEVFPRSVFPETWIFEDLEMDDSNTSLKLKVPDTITTWIVRAYSVNDHSGFTMLEKTLDIKAFQPFFISMNLPYAVKRGEVVTIPITIFNYLYKNYETEVSLDNSKQDFVFLDDDNRPNNKNEDKRTINIPPKNGKSVSFIIKPKRVGDIDIKITAKNSETSDAIIQKLKVEPEGLKKQFNQDVALNMIQGKSKTSKFYAQIPTNIVPESEYLVFSVSGDILVSTLENLDDLVLKPYGCGEQNMINLAPNILVLDYLKALNKMTNLTQLVDKAKQFIDSGYQQELIYRHPSGGYSVFGPGSGRTESNWLTAYVTRFFIKGLKYSAIEPRIIEGGLEFLAQQQADDGSFPQIGHLFHPSHQNEYGFSAFVLMTYLEDAKYSKKYSKNIEKGLQYLTSKLESINDAYSLAIVANVFQATANSNVNEVLKKLKQIAQEENGLMWWSSKNKKNSMANSVEITSYALMALLETSGHYASVFNWLIRQRNSHGGFGSTQDTVVGLQALIKYAEKSPHASTDETQVKLSYVAKDGDGNNIKENFLEVNTDNQLVLQQEELPQNTRSLDVLSMGEGKVFLQFTYQYYISPEYLNAAESPPAPAVGYDIVAAAEPQSPKPIILSLAAEYKYFIIKPLAKLSPINKALTLAICYSYQPQDFDDSLTNMVILQVQLPSSYVANHDNVEQLKDEEQVSRVELQNASTMLAIYFERLEANNEQCLTVMGDKLHDVAELKASTIQMYDYYNPEQRSEVQYNISS